MIGTQASDVDEAIAFIKSEMTLPDGRTLGAALDRDPWIERDVLRPALARDTAGLPLYKLCWIESHKGSGKTNDAAALAMCETLRASDVEVIVIASDLDQAGLIAEAINAQLRRSPRLASMFRATKDRYEVRRTGSVIKIMSSDAPSFHGVGVTCRRLVIIADELGQWLKRDLYDAAIITLPKVRDSRMIVITNAGLAGSWQQDARGAAELPGNYLFAPRGVIASWISAADVARIEASVPDAIFRRYYRNEWVSSSSGFLADMAIWDRLRGNVAPLDTETPLVIGVDIGLKHDFTAAVAVSRDPARLDDRDAVAVRSVGVWQPPRGGELDLDETLWPYLVTFCERFNVCEIAYDSSQASYLMQRLERELGTWCYEFNQNRLRLLADTALLLAIRQGKVAHSGEPDLRACVANAAFEMNAQEQGGGRITKSAPDRKVDALVGLSMAAYECRRLLMENFAHRPGGEVAR